MKPDSVIRRLQEHHRGNERCLSDGKTLLEEGDACQLKALELIRWQLMRALRAYQLFKHVEVFDPIIASQCPKRAREAEELKRKCIEIGQQYEEHVRRWTLTGPAHSWPRYLGDAEHIIGRLRAHLAEEAKRIDQLIAGLQRTRQPPSNVGNQATRLCRVDQSTLFSERG